MAGNFSRTANQTMPETGDAESGPSFFCWRKFDKSQSSWNYEVPASTLGHANFRPLLYQNQWSQPFTLQHQHEHPHPHPQTARIIITNAAPSFPMRRSPPLVHAQKIVPLNDGFNSPFRLTIASDETKHNRSRVQEWKNNFFLQKKRFQETEATWKGLSSAKQKDGGTISPWYRILFMRYRREASHARSLSRNSQLLLRTESGEAPWMCQVSAHEHTHARNTRMHARNTHTHKHAHGVTKVLSPPHPISLIQASNINNF